MHDGELTVEDLIQALQKFPKNWFVQMGVPNSDETAAIKGIFDCSEAYEYGGGLQYAFVQIEPISDIDYYDISIAGNVRMGGDGEWYNTKDTFRSVMGNFDSVVYRLNEKGDVEVIKYEECEDPNFWRIEEDEFNLEQYLDDKIKEASKERSIRLAEAKAANNLRDLIKSDIVLDTVFYYDGMLEALKEVKEKVRNV